MEITIIGGDKRNLELANLFKKDGYRVNLVGFDADDISTSFQLKSMEDALYDADIVVGPIPLTTDGIHINSPLNGLKLGLNDLINSMKKNQVFMAGKISQELESLIESRGIKTLDLMDREDMAVLNSIPTAEGAIQIAMEEMDTTIFASNVLVLGFGRLGKILAKTLAALGARVSVAARKTSDLSWIRAYGYEAIDIKDLYFHLEDKDLIYNTIASRILDEKALMKINKKSMIIDLASKPGGLDFDKARKLGIRAIWALGLPGRVAPHSAAQILRDTIYNIMEDLEVMK
ncbi:MAG: dipicolinate synthase subunit DpsA [Tissierellaceae bacterium]